MLFAPQLAALEFPPKKLFGNRDERMIAERRNHLEVKSCVKPANPQLTTDSNVMIFQRYLRNLFQVMLSSSDSPLRCDGGLQLTKRNVCEFSAFFRKGVFENSSHGTG